MAITTSDAKRLWGNAAGRCSICHVEVGALGQIAHIVARKVSGPRGGEPLPLELRDEYDNLILLCPNHHLLVDSNANEWPVEELRCKRVEHEAWVQQRLEQGTLPLYTTDSFDFSVQRRDYWREFNEHAWIYLSFTPLELEEVIDPLTQEDLLSTLPTPQIFHNMGFGVAINRNYTESSPGGLLNECFNLSKGIGFRVEIFRTGHIEYATCIDRCFLGIDELNSPRIRQAQLTEQRLIPCGRLLIYEDLADTILTHLEALKKLWREVPVPTQSMLLTLSLLNCRGACLRVANVYQQPSLVGRAVEKDDLSYQIVAEREWEIDELYNALLSRLVSMLGLRLNAKWVKGDAVPIPCKFSG